MFLNVKAVSVLQSEEKHLHGLFEVPASHHLKRQETRPYWPAGKQIRTPCPRDHHHVLAVMWSVPVGPWSTSLAAGFSKPRRPCIDQATKDAASTWFGPSHYRLLISLVSERQPSAYPRSARQRPSQLADAR